MKSTTVVKFCSSSYFEIEVLCLKEKVNYYLNLLVFYNSHLLENIVLDEDGVIRMEDINFEPNSNGLGDELFRAMIKNKDKIAQVCSIFLQCIRYTCTIIN